MSNNFICFNDVCLAASKIVRFQKTRCDSKFCVNVMLHLIESHPNFSDRIRPVTEQICFDSENERQDAIDKMREAMDRPSVVRTVNNESSMMNVEPMAGWR